MATLPERDKYKILLIEDNLIDRKLIREFIEQTKFTEFELKDTDRLSSGLQLLSDESFDAVLLDLFLPDARKLEALDKIIDCKADLPIVILTGLGDEDLGISAVRKGAQDYLVKGDFERSLLIRSITYAIERKRAEIALIESEKKYRVLFESSGEGRIISDPNGMILDANPAAAAILGYKSPEELKKIRMTDLYMYPEQRKELFENLVKRGSIEGREITGKKKDGMPFHTLATFIAHKDEEGEILKVDGVFRDITARKRAEEALQQKTLDLEERVKELNCLYGVSQLTRDPQRPIDEVLRQVTSLVPQAWQYPDITCVKIEFKDRIFKTKNYKKTPWLQTSDIIVSGKRGGNIEVGYIEEMPVIFEGPFLKEERDLIDALAREIGNFDERTKINEELRKSEARYRQLVDSMGEIIFSLTPEGIITSVNPAFERITGWSCEEFIDKPFLRLIHPDDLQIVLEGFESFTKGKKLINYDVRIKTKSGSYIIIEGKVTPQIESGKLIGFFGIAHDITQRKEMEEALRRSEEKYRNIIENLTDIVVETDVEGNFTYVSPQVFNLLGMKPEDVIGKNGFHFIHPDDLEGTGESLLRALDGEHVFNYEYRARHKDGHYVPFSVSGRAIPEDNTIKLVGVLRDITERMNAEEKLRVSEVKYKSIIENLSDAVVEMDVEGNFTFVSPQGVNLLGMKSEDVIGKNGFQFIHPDDLERAGESLQKAIEGERVFDFVFRARHKDGHYVPLSASGKIAGEEDNLRVNLLIRNISDIIEADEALKRSEENYRLLFESAPIGISMADLEGNVIECNQTMLDITGYNSDEIKSISLPDTYVNPEDQNKLLQILQESGGVQDFETLLKHKDGTPYVSLLNAVLMNLGEQQVLLTIQRDLTQWRELERSKGESEDQYKAIFENVPIGLYRTTPDGRFIAANSAFLEMVGYNSFDELSLHNSEELSMNFGYSRELFLTAIAKEGIFHGLEQQITRPDGSVISVRENTRAVKDENSSVSYYEGSFEDITVYKEFEQSLKESEEKYRVLFQHAPIGIGFTDFEGKFLAWNSTLMEITGCSEYEIFNIKLSQLFINSEDFQLLIQALQNNKRVQDREVHLKRKEGTNFYALLDIELIEYMEQKTLHITIRDISEQKHAEEALRKNEEKYRSLINNLTDIVIESDLQGKFTFVSPQSFDLLGYKPDELVGKNGFDLIHPNDLEKTMEELRKASQGNFTFFFEYRLKHKNGHYIPIIASARIIDLDIEARVIWVGRDVSERKKSEEKYQILLNNLTDTVVELDSEGNFIFISPQIFKISGYKPEELIGTNSLEFIHPDDIETINDVLKKVLEGESVFNYECRGKHKDGYYIWLSISSRVVEAADRTNIVSIIQDITERKQIEIALRESEVRFRQLVETSPDGIVLTDLLGDITLINKQGATNLGYKDEYDLITTNIFELIVPEDQELALRTMKETLKTGKGVNLEYNFMKKDGTHIPVEMNTTVIKDTTESKRYFMATIRDITESKEAMRLLQESEKKYRRILENIEDSYYEVDLTGNFTFFNDQLCDLLGCSRNELTGTNYKQFGDDTSAHRVYQIFNTVFQTGKPTKGFEWEILSKDGNKKYVDVSISLITDSSGAEVGFRGIARDVTKRREAAEALQQSEERLRSFMDSATESIYLLDHDLNIVDLNKNSLKVLRTTKKEIIGKNILHIDPSLKTTGRYNRLLEVIETGEPDVEYNVASLPKIGDKLFTVRTFKVGDGLGIMSADITEQIQAQKAVKRSEEHFREIFTSAPIGMVLVDLDYSFLRVNVIFCHMLGYTEQELTKMTFQDVTHPDHMKRDIEHAKKLAKQEIVLYKTEKRYITKNKKILWTRTSVTLLFDEKEDPHCYLAMIEDIGQEKRVEEEIRKQLMKFKIENGNIYLIPESSPTLSKQVFNDLIKVGYSGRAISRIPEKEFKKEFDLEFQFLWFSETREKNSLPPQLNEIEKIIDGMQAKSVIWIDRLDYLISKNGFKKTLKSVFKMREIAYLNDLVVILSVDPETLSKQHIRSLKKETKTVEPRFLVRVPDEMLEVLRLVFQNNNLGVKPSYTDIGNELEISKPTTRKRIKELVATGYLNEQKSGNRKLLELTEKGLMVFKK